MKKLFALFLLCSACLAAGEPTPESAPAPRIAIPTPSPSPEVAQSKAQWLIAGSTDPAIPFGANPKTTFFVVNGFEVVVTPLGYGSMVTFRPLFAPSP